MNIMKRHLLLLFTALMLLCLSLGMTSGYALGDPALSLDPGAAVVHEVSVNDQVMSELVIYKNKTAKLKAVLENAEKPKNLKFKWSSSDLKVAAVASGVVTGKGPGVAEITCAATLADGTNLTATVRVRVEVAITQLVAKPTAVTVPVGKQVDAPELKITPASATCSTFTWTSEDPAVATVDENGVITGVKAGTTKITATANESLAKPKAICVKVTVVQGVNSIDLSEENLKINKGATAKLTATVQPSDATIQKFTWTSSDPKVAAVVNGTITGKGPGNAVITCTATDGSGSSASCNVEVVAPVTTVAMSQKTVTAFTGKAGPQLALVVKPEGAKYYDVEWSSSNESVVKVDQNGVLTTVGGGKATITATVTSNVGAKSAPKKATCAVTVNQPVERISIAGKDEIDLFKGKTQKLTASVQPSTASNTKVIWSSSDPKVVSVTNVGQITAKSGGKATITCTAADGSGVKDTVVVNVRQAVTSVKFNQRSEAVTEGKSTYVYATVLPENASFKKLKWWSDNSYIASVDAYGKVTGRHGGSCNIYAEATDGSGKAAKIKVYVEPINPITLESIGFGVYQYNLLGMTVRNDSQSKTITDFDFDVKLYSYMGTLVNSGSYSLGKQVSIGPNRTKTIKRTLYGVGQAYRVVITITSVSYSDGSTYYIPVNERDTWTFRR